MKTILLYFFLSLIIFSAKAQSIIIIQHGSTTLLATTIDSAIIKAQSGDYIYLPGGLIASANSDNIVIDKLLNIFGAGYNSDSSTATSITNFSKNIIFNQGAEGSLISGISTSGNVTLNCSNIIISRCNVNRITVLPASVSNILIEENIVREDLWGNGNAYEQVFSNFIFRKNLLYGGFNFFSNHTSMSFINNIFFGQSFGVGNCLYQNNVFMHNGPVSWGSSANTFNNNLLTFPGNFPSGSINSNNFFNQPISSVFTSYSYGDVWNSKQNFHLQTSSIGKNAGSDGTDIGIYGSTAPFKEGGIPINPHIQSATVGTTTNSNGRLSINITVTAQNQ